MQPSWSMMRTSSCDGGWQNFCWRICRMCSMTLGVSLRATAMWPRARIVWSGIRWASLKEQDDLFLEQFYERLNRLKMKIMNKIMKIIWVTTQHKVVLFFFPHWKCCLLVIFLWNVKTIGQTGQKSLHYDLVHGETSFQTSERQEAHTDEKYIEEIS